MVESFPLHWPLGYKRAKYKKHAPFQTSFAKARDGSIYELKRMGATNIIISTNIPIKKDGNPYAIKINEWKTVTEDTGIAVYFTFNKQQKVICCDAYIAFDDNMQAINKTVEAFRGIDRWNCSDIINQTFTGFSALPEKTEDAKWNEILEVKLTASEQEIKEAYRKKAMIHHPDKGGNPDTFNIISKAYSQGLNSLNPSQSLP